MNELPEIDTLAPSLLDVLIALDYMGIDVYVLGDDLAMVAPSPALTMPTWLAYGISAHKQSLLARLRRLPAGGCKKVD